MLDFIIGLNTTISTLKFSKLHLASKTMPLHSSSRVIFILCELSLLVLTSSPNLLTMKYKNVLK
ncbi:hypothetical protein Dimus_039331 [Dionaea muscipula]